MRITFVGAAREWVRQVRPARYDSDVQPHRDVRCRLRDAGHIPGSAILEVDLARNGTAARLVFGGDLGQPVRPILRGPTPGEEADLLISVTFRVRRCMRASWRSPSARAARRAMLACAVSGLALQWSGAQAAREDALPRAHCSPDETVRFRGATARLENDMFAGTDQNYTNGVAFALVSHDMAGRLRPECLPWPVRLHARLIAWADPAFWDDPHGGGTQNVVARFGQSMYTPRDFSRIDLITDDRPYAGLLYLGLSWNRRRHDPAAALESLDTREITFGVIGPWSLARQSQNLVHDMIGEDRFLGWKHQLKNEPAMQVAADRKFRKFRGNDAIVPGFSADAIPSWGLRLGNIETSAAVGIEGRIGWNLPNDFGSYPIRPGAENRPPSAASIRRDDAVARRPSPPRPGVHLFGVLETRVVGYDFSLDGNLFRSSHEVTRRPWVAQAAVGFSVHTMLAGHGVRLAAMRVHRSREFEQQRGRQSYGSIALSVEF